MKRKVWLTPSNKEVCIVTDFGNGSVQIEDLHGMNLRTVPASTLTPTNYLERHKPTRKDIELMTGAKRKRERVEQERSKASRRDKFDNDDIFNYET